MALLPPPCRLLGLFLLCLVAAESAADFSDSEDHLSTLNGLSGRRRTARTGRTTMTTTTTTTTVTATAVAAPITFVHVVQSNHLDVGFDGIDPTIGFAVNVVRRYFDVYFPRAVRVGAQLIQRQEERLARLRKGTGKGLSPAPADLRAGLNPQLRWMTQPWLLDLYLHCDADFVARFFPVPPAALVPPSNRTWEPLRCPSARDVSELRAALRNQTVVYHAWPFNGEAELGLDSGSLFEAGIAVTRRLDAQYRTPFGLPATRTMSQRDVPGTTRSVVPLLRKNGVRCLTVGVNGGSAPPAVPRQFIWHDGVSNSSILALWHPGGYGGTKRQDAAVAHGQALIPAWRGDNAGPPLSAEEVEAQFQEISAEFPEVDPANIVASTFDSFVEDALLPAQAAGELSTVTAEIGDTWVYGAASDPWKLAAMRAIMVLRRECVEDTGGCGKGWLSGQCQECRWFDWLTLKNLEHTWGLDVKTFLHDWTNWNNTQFEAARKSGENYALMEASWAEQRGYLSRALSLLNSTQHPLAPRIEAALLELQPKAPSLDGLVQVARPQWAEPWICQADETVVKLALDSSSGAITLLDAGGSSFASAASPLAEFIYSSYSSDDYTTFLEQYVNCMAPNEWEKWLCFLAHELDFAKPLVKNAHPIQRDWAPQVMQVARAADGCKWVIELSLPSVIVRDYGAPKTVWLEATITGKTAGEIALALDVVWLDKTPTRLPEALWLKFGSPMAAAAEEVIHPVGTGKRSNSANAALRHAITRHSDSRGQWKVDKLGELVDVEGSAVVLNGSNHIHGVQAASFWEGKLCRMNIAPRDAGVVAVGSPNPFPTPFRSPLADGGLYSLLSNNIWGTNYIMWYPFSNEDAGSRFRYNVSFYLS